MRGIRNGPDAREADKTNGDWRIDLQLSGGALGSRLAMQTFGFQTNSFLEGACLRQG